MLFLKRRVIQIANSTQLISLPRKWALQNKIKKGDELEILENGNKLYISTGPQSEKNIKEIDISNLNPIIPRIMHALYKVGYDEIKINFSNPQMLDIIQQRLQEEIIGFEIIEQKSNYCVVKAFAGGVESEFDVVLRRIFLLLKSMADGILEAIEKKDTSMIKSLRHLEANNNKYTGHCRRIINKGLYNSKNVAIMYSTIEELEKIADEYKYLCDFFIGNPKIISNVSKECQDMFKNLNKFFDACYELFYKFDMKKCAELFEKRKELITNVRSTWVKKKLAATDIAIIHYYLVILQKIANILSFKFEMEH